MGSIVGIDAAKKVIQLVIDGKLPSTFKLGELQRKNLAGLKGDHANKALEMLEMYGWARLEIMATSGRPSTICTIHPKADFFLKSPHDPLTKVTKGGKRGFSEFSECPTAAFSKIKATDAVAPNVTKVGMLGMDGKIIVVEKTSENDEAKIGKFTGEKLVGASL